MAKKKIHDPLFPPAMWIIVGFATLLIIMFIFLNSDATFGKSLRSAVLANPDSNTLSAE